MTANLLLVDDEPDAIELFRQSFRREIRQGACVIQFAQSGDEALDLLAHSGLAERLLMLSDINMPGMSGLDLLREVKQRWPELPVIMITAYGDAEKRRLAKDFGASDFITKPVDFAQLKATLGSHMHGDGI